MSGRLVSMKKKFPTTISKTYTHIFTIPKDGLYVIFLIASCRSGGQIGKNKADEDLRFTLDGFAFRQILSKNRMQFYNIPPSWSGAQQRGSEKTVAVFSYLEKGPHELHFFPQPTATLVSIGRPQFVSDPQKILFPLHLQAKNDDRKPWIVFALRSLPLVQASVKVHIEWHTRDGDDVKISFDSQVVRNISSVLHKNWNWHALPRQKESFSQSFALQYHIGLHTIGFEADKTPTLEEVGLNLGTQNVARIPNVLDPKWLGDYARDPDEILLARMIFGEGESQSKQAKIGIGFSVVNRVKKQHLQWGTDIKSILLNPAQYQALWHKKRGLVCQDPLNGADAVRYRTWDECANIALLLMTGELKDTIKGATHFIVPYKGFRWPKWANEKNFRIKIDAVYFYELDA